MSAPGEGTRISEAQLLSVCEQSVKRCRDALEELKRHAKAARSHREKCSSLLAAATTAVMNLEALLYSQDIDVYKEKQLQHLCTGVQTAIDQGEAVVRVYGQMGALGKFANKLFSPDTTAKFDELTQELSKLARQVHKVMDTPSQPSPAPRGVAAAAAAATALGAISSQPSAGGMSTSSAAPTEATQTTAENAAAPAFTPGTPPSGSTPPPAPSFTLDTRSFIQRDAAVPVEALQKQRLHRGSRGHAVTAMLYVPPSPHALAGNMGRMWYYVSRAFSGGMYVHDLSNQVSVEVKEAKADNTVTCIHLDPADGRLWTGHKKGYVRVWDEAQRAPLCEPTQVFNSAVRALTTDENGLGWAGSESGKVKCLSLEDVVRDGARISEALVVKGTLKWAGPGMPDVASAASSSGEASWVDSKHLKEPAHYGTVTSIAAAMGRVWTAGGSSAFVCLREWTQRGEFIASTDLRSVGTANSMLITTPVVRVMSNTDRAPSVTASIVSTRGTAAGPGAQAEVTQFWQLLTGHDSGLIQVWTPVGHVLRPILRIGDRMAPAKGIVICEQLGVVCTAHSDGRLLVRSLPHPKGPAALTVTYTPNSVSAVKLPSAEIEASKTGLALADGGMVGVITASNNGTITLWPEGELRSAAQEKGLALQSEHLLREQWPLHCISAADATAVATAVLQLALSEASNPADFVGSGETISELGAAVSNPLLPGQSGSVGVRKQSLFEQSGAAFDWRIDYSELTFIRVIGEGAIGKVWLGRFQETDVAIKQLNSLDQLVGAPAQQGSSSSGGNSISKDALRTLEREVGIMVRIRHPNVILFMGVCLEPPCVVTEFCARGSLYDVLKQARNNPAMSRQLDWGKRLHMAMDAAKGMYHLHSHKPAIIHRDLKSPNLLVDKHWRVKVTDFNLSRITETGPAVQSSLTANNPRWLAPEVIQRQAFSKASDVYAFGLILWELITWEVPFKDMSQFQIMMALTQQHARPEVPDEFAQLPGGMFPLYQQYVALMQWCWAEDPEQRPSMDQVIAELRTMLEQMSHRARNAPLPSPTVAQAASHRFSGGVDGGHGRRGSHGAATAVQPEPDAAALVAPAQPGPEPGPGSGPGPHDSVASRLPGSPYDSAAGADPARGAAVRCSSPFDSAASSAAVPAAAEVAAGVAAGAAVAAAAKGPLASPFDVSSSAQEAGPSAAEHGQWGGPVAASSETAAAAPPAPQRIGHEVSAKTLQQSSAAAAPAGGTTVLASNGPPPSPFGDFGGFSAAPAASSSPTLPPAPQQQAGPSAAAGPATVLAANGPPPSPFGDAFAAPAAAPPAQQPATVLAADGPPPSPFGGSFAAPAAAAAAPPQPPATVLAANGPPPSPFGDGFAVPAAPPQPPATVLAANGPPPSPFGDSFAVPAAPAPPQPLATVLAANGPPPSPFGDGFAVPAAPAPPQPPATVFAANGPPPSPFGGGFAVPAGPAPPQPPATVLAANGPPPSPFGDGFAMPAATVAPQQTRSPFDAGGPGAAAMAGSAAAAEAVPGQPRGDLWNIDSVENNAGMSPHSSQCPTGSDTSLQSHPGSIGGATEGGTDSPQPPMPEQQQLQPLPQQQQQRPQRTWELLAQQQSIAETLEGDGEEDGGRMAGAQVSRSNTAPSKLIRKFRNSFSGRRGSDSS